MPRFLFLALTIVLVCASASPAQAELSVDAQARLIGGFAPRGFEANDPAVARITGSPEWQRASRASFAALLANNANLFSRGSQAQMRRFFSSQLGQASGETRGLLYFFGGADVLYPNVLFPNVEHILLVGLESPGQILNPEALLAQGTLGLKMQEVASAFRDITRVSYFITKNMAKDLREFGTSTMIAVGLVADGFQITGVEPVYLDAQGNLLPGSGGRVRGVRVNFVKQNGQRGDVVYLRFDLSDRNRLAQPEFDRFVRSGPFQTAFYKAASFVSHNGAFAGLNRLVLGKVSHVVESDDGIPFRFLRESAGEWNVRLYGLYTPPARLFGSAYQQDLLAAYRDTLCRSATPQDIAVWEKVWGPSVCAANSANFGFASLTWEGTIPFRYGYAAVSGPGVLPWPEKSKFGNLILLDRR